MSWKTLVKDNIFTKTVFFSRLFDPFLQRCGAELHLEGCSPIVPCLRQGCWLRGPKVLALQVDSLRGFEMFCAPKPRGFSKRRPKKHYIGEKTPSPFQLLTCKVPIFAPKKRPPVILKPPGAVENAGEGVSIAAPSRPSFGSDVCRFVAWNCPEKLQPGESCEVHCRAPYEGEATVARCSVENTKATGGESSWVWVEWWWRLLDDTLFLWPTEPLVDHVVLGKNGFFAVADMFPGSKAVVEEPKTAWLIFNSSKVVFCTRYGYGSKPRTPGDP